MVSEKFGCEKINGKTNFELWMLKTWDLIVQKGLHKALISMRKKSVTMTNDGWTHLEGKDHSVIQFSHVANFLFNIITEVTTT